MKIIGITGGIGSGKSTISKILKEQYNAYIIDTDSIAHRLMSNGNVSYELILEYFGEEILNEDKEINRVKLGQVVYDNKEKLLKLNSFTHPYVMDHVKDLIRIHKDSHSIIGVETALPLEANLISFCDEIWFVQASNDIRRKRLMESRGYSKEKIDAIFSKQISDSEYEKLSTHIIHNDGNMDKILKEIQVSIEKNACL